MPTRIQALFLALTTIALAPRPAVTQQPPPACADVEGFAALDFWVGEWTVMVGADTVGYNSIEKVLNGCALTERWQARGGGEGRSLFYYVPAEEVWKQVWVTGRAMAPGGVKEKTLIEHYDDGGVRFQGVVTLLDGRVFLDRTTLTPREDGTVRQHIEISPDDGENWRTTFDAVYVPASS